MFQSRCLSNCYAGSNKERCPVAENMTLGLSPCPNDTYIFHALLHHLVPSPAHFTPRMADVEELNALARQKKLPVTKLSLGVVPYIMDDYAIMASGAALGWGCGPLVVAREDLPEEKWKTARVAVPGLMTTANLLLTLHGGFQGSREEMLFSDVMDAVLTGEADMGVIIHEGRFTYADRGLVKLLDLGQWWEATYHAPLPLGAIAVRRDVPVELARAIEAAITASVDYANANPRASAEFIREHAQELAESVTSAHIKTFVTEYSRDLGETGRQAIARLVETAAKMQGLRLPEAGLFL